MLTRNFSTERSKAQTPSCVCAQDHSQEKEVICNICIDTFPPRERRTHPPGPGPARPRGAPWDPLPLGMAESLLTALADRLSGGEEKVRLLDGSLAAGSQGISGDKQLALLTAVTVKPFGLFASTGSGDEAEKSRLAFWEEYLKGMYVSCKVAGWCFFNALVTWGRPAVWFSETVLRVDHVDYRAVQIRHRRTIRSKCR